MPETVLDASVVLALVLPDENADHLQAVEDLIMGYGGVVPAHWFAEVGNVLALAVRRGRLTSEYRLNAIETLRELSIATDWPSAIACLGAVQRLSDQHALSVYDASYIELAQRRSLGLATLDKRLASAARAEAVTVLGPLA